MFSDGVAALLLPLRLRWELASGDGLALRLRETFRGGLPVVASIDLTLLGGFEVRLSQGPAVTVPTRKAQGLLAYLALPCGLAHPRDKVAALLWGDMREGQARTNLRQTLSTLRRALRTTASDGLRLDAANLALEPKSVNVDVATFELLVTQATPTSLAQAATVYRGDLLQGLAVHEGPFEEWLMGERERLRELAIEALARLLAQQRAAGATELALQTALRLLALDPLLEPVHRTLMRLYAQLGRRDTALRQYKTCVEVLDRELGVEPEEETRQLYQDILRVRFVSSPSAATFDVAASRSPVSAPHLPDVRTGPDLRLIGRETDLAHIRRSMAEAQRGRSRLLVILGEAGIGKSRLVGELVAEAVQAGGSRVLLGRCHEGGQAMPFGPWAEAFRSSGHVGAELSRLQDDPPWRRELSRLLPELDWDHPSDAAAPDSVRLFEAVVALLGRLAATQPLIVILEDLHWADDMSVRLLAYLGHRVRDWSVLLVVTARPEEPDARALAGWIEAQQREPHVRRLVLAPLSNAEIVTLVHSAAPADLPAATLANLGEQIWRISEGNPFVAVEAMRALPNEAAGAAAADICLPACVRESIARRLDGLTPNAAQLAAVAAVLGRDFDFHLLLRSAGLPEPVTAEGLEELVRRYVLEPKGDRFAFVHDRVREVAYGRLLAPRRKLLHGRVAEALETLYAGHLQLHYAPLGLHYAKGEQWAKAAALLRKAGIAAIARAAYREALACLDQALACAAHLPDEPEAGALIADLRVDLCQPLLSLGELPRLLETLRAAEALATTLGAVPGDEEVGHEAAPPTGTR